MPDIQISMLAVVVAVVANFFIGFLWYNPLFGKAWAVEMGFDPEEQPPGSEMARSMIIMLIGNFLMVWVFANNMAVWNPVTWGLAPSEIAPATNALMAAFFTWLGFFLPIDLGGVAWEKKTWKLVGINASYHLVVLIVVALILTYL